MRSMLAAFISTTLGGTDAGWIRCGADIGVGLLVGIGPGVDGRKKPRVVLHLDVLILQILRFVVCAPTTVRVHHRRKATYNA